MYHEKGRVFSQTRAEGLDENGRPIKRAGAEPSVEVTLTYPSVQGATNWYSPSYSPRSGLFYLSVREYASVYFKGDPTYVRGNRYIGSLPRGVIRTSWWTPTRVTAPCGPWPQDRRTQVGVQDDQRDRGWGSDHRRRRPVLG